MKPPCPVLHGSAHGAGPLRAVSRAGRSLPLEAFLRHTSCPSPRPTRPLRPWVPGLQKQRSPPATHASAAPLGASSATADRAADVRGTFTTSSPLSRHSGDLRLRPATPPAPCPPRSGPSSSHTGPLRPGKAELCGHEGVSLMRLPRSASFIQLPCHCSPPWKRCLLQAALLGCSVQSPAAPAQPCPSTVPPAPAPSSFPSCRPPLPGEGRGGEGSTPAWSPEPPAQRSAPAV